MNTVYNCKVCEKALSGKQRSFCSIACKNDYYQSYEPLKKRALERKTRLLDVFGGACMRCGYARVSALSFYDQTGHSLHVDTTILANSSYNKLLERVDKAQVLCRNCVEEVQNPKHRDCFLPRNDAGLLENKFTKNLARCGVKPGQTIVLGVSGGVDSVAMLDLFAKTDLRLDILVAHMNHGVREEAVKDEELVRKLAKKHSFKFFSKTIGIPASGNLENSLRDERRKFLLDTANNNGDLQGPTLLALAHHADDQAETFIMHAVRGSGPAGLGGMSMSDDAIIRPLLDISRAEIESYARAIKLVWREDVTNLDTSYDRNYVRHRILPLLGRLNPEYLGAIGRTTYLQRRVDEHIKEEALYVIARSQGDAPARDDSYRPGTISPPPVIPAKAGIQREDGLDSSSWAGMTKNVGISTEKLRRLDKPLLYEVLGLLYERARGERTDLSLSHLAGIEELIQSDAGTKNLDLPGGIVARRRYDKLDFCEKKAHNTSSTPSTKKLKVGKQRFGEWQIMVSPLCHPCEGEELLRRGRKRSLGLRPGMTTRREDDEISIDVGALPHLIIRTRKPGDMIQKVGMRGRKKLQDLFVDAKIDRDIRDKWPIIIDARVGQVLWVPGLAKAKINTKNKALLTINIERRNF